MTSGLRSRTAAMAIAALPKTQRQNSKGGDMGEPDNVLGCIMTEALIPVSGFPLSECIASGGWWRES